MKSTLSESLHLGHVQKVGTIVIAPYCELTHRALVDIFWSHSKRLQTEAILSGRNGTDKFTDYEFVDYQGLLAHNYGFSRFCS